MNRMLNVAALWYYSLDISLKWWQNWTCSTWTSNLRHVRNSSTRYVLSLESIENKNYPLLCSHVIPNITKKIFVLWKSVAWIYLRLRLSFRIQHTLVAIFTMYKRSFDSYVPMSCWSGWGQMTKLGIFFCSNACSCFYYFMNFLVSKSSMISCYYRIVNQTNNPIEQIWESKKFRGHKIWTAGRIINVQKCWNFFYM